MRNIGIIENFEPVINITKLGLTHYAFILKLNYITPDEEKTLTELINSCEKITRAIKSLNNEEYFLNAVVEKENEIEEIKDLFQNILKEKIVTLDLFRIT